MEEKRLYVEYFTILYCTMQLVIKYVNVTFYIDTNRGDDTVVRIFLFVAEVHLLCGCFDAP